jgi:hypothetical protein
MEVVFLAKKAELTTGNIILKQAVLSAQEAPDTYALDVVLMHVKKLLVLSYDGVRDAARRVPKAQALPLLQVREFFRVSYEEVDTLDSIAKINAHLKELRTYVQGRLLPSRFNLSHVTYTLETLSGQSRMCPIFFEAKIMTLDGQLDDLKIPLPARLVNR